jgi:beta-1,4-mannosyl-glycoprotein beta-1,4-N-acetylglucosaminyltransferase
MIYDCFTFYNCLDLLEIRFHELANVVDYFVIVEAKERFDRVKKPMYYYENRHRFDEFKDKIIHIGLKRLEGYNLEERGVWQGNQIMRGLTKAKDTDLIIFSDNDEIPRAKSIKHLKFPFAPFRPFHQPMYMFYVNWFWTWRWNGSVILTYDYLVNHCKTPRQARLDRRHGIKIDNGGWHFSQLGTEEDAIIHRKNNYHQEGVILNEAEIKEARRTGQWWMVGKRLRKAKLMSITKETHPEYLVNNQNKFLDIIGGKPSEL